WDHTQAPAGPPGPRPTRRLPSPKYAPALLPAEPIRHCVSICMSICMLMHEVPGCSGRHVPYVSPESGPANEAWATAIAEGSDAFGEIGIRRRCPVLGDVGADAAGGCGVDHLLGGEQADRRSAGESVRELTDAPRQPVVWNDLTHQPHP